MSERDENRETHDQTRYDTGVEVCAKCGAIEHELWEFECGTLPSRAPWTPPTPPEDR